MLKHSRPTPENEIQPKGMSVPRSGIQSLPRRKKVDHGVSIWREYTELRARDGTIRVMKWVLRPNGSDVERAGEDGEVVG